MHTNGRWKLSLFDLLIYIAFLGVFFAVVRLYGFRLVGLLAFLPGTGAFVVHIRVWRETVTPQNWLRCSLFGGFSALVLYFFLAVTLGQQMSIGWILLVTAVVAPIATLETLVFVGGVFILQRLFVPKKSR